MIEWSFNKHKFYTQGHNIGFIPKSIATKCKEIIKTTKWVNDKPSFAGWCLIPDDEKDELFYEELVRGKMSYGQAPTEIKNLANEVIDMEFFNPLKELLVKVQHSKYKGIRNIKPCSMGLWDKQLDVAMHNDISDTSDFFILMYFNDYDQWDTNWGGQLKIGREDLDGKVYTIAEHYPHDSTFVLVNNTNPLFYHQVCTAEDKHRYTFSFRYVIE